MKPGATSEGWRPVPRSTRPSVGRAPAEDLRGLYPGAVTSGGGHIAVDGNDASRMPNQPSSAVTLRRCSRERGLATDQHRETIRDAGGRRADNA